MHGGRGMLRLDQVRLSLGEFALSADWQVPKEARLAVIGPSGTGKSSLLLAIAGFLQPAQGHIFWNGQDITALPAQGRPVSMLFQDQNLFPHLTLAQNVVLGLTAGRRAAPDQVAHADHALARVGLQGMGARKPAQVSGGQMARAALARVLLQARPLLLLDEPFAALDAELRVDMRDLLDQVARETQATVLMVSHDLRDAQRFASHVVQVDGGVAAAPVAKDAFFTTPK
jgi:thiamine transport system ATP-binding protein